jgi:inosine-uridine nucleoside N-ribohydrolase
MIKIHLDTDIGGDIDDLCALAMLLKWPEVEISGITTVADEGGRRAGYAKYALRLAGRSDTPVAAGADVDQVPYRWRPTYPAESDYWPEPVSPDLSPNSPGEALELIKSSIEAGAIVVAIGPVTNLALLDQRYPGLLGAARVCLMGGYVAPIPAGYPQRGNETDYNFQMDIESARRIIERYQPVLVPLSATVQTALRSTYLPGLRQAGPLGALIAR